MADEKLRVGDSNSPVKIGDPVPGSPGHYYEAGMYAPSIEKLTSLKLQEMNTAGLLPQTNLDIYGEDGDIDEAKVAAIDAKAALRPFGIHDSHPDLPPFALVGFVSTAEKVDKALFRYLNITYLDWVADPTNQTDPTYDQQLAVVAENVDVRVNNPITGYKRTKLDFVFTIFQPYFVFLSVPIVPSIQNVSSGLNTAAVSTLKTLGYILFEKTRLDDKEFLYEFLKLFGWKSVDKVPEIDSRHYRLAGEEIGMRRRSKWARDTRRPAISVSSTFSPKENFSELFMQYYFHRSYLAAKSQSYVDFFENMLEELARRHRWE